MLRIVEKSSLAGVLILLLGTVACNQRLNSLGEPTKQLPAAHLTSVPLSYADVVDHVAPAVVTVRSSRRVRSAAQYPFFNDPFLRQFFGGGFGMAPQEQVEQALGSGVIVRPDGHILTNHHVIDGAQDIKVDLYDQRTFNATLVGSDPPSDLAVLKINAGNLPVLTLGDSDKVRVGDICLAIGNPLGVGQTVTNGIISAKKRHTGLSNGSFEDFLQTDAPINQGNSGGALVNTTGELIGINSQIISTTGGSIGLGFAIPSNMARIVMDQLIGRGKVERGHLGVGVQSLTSSLAASFGLKQTKGVVINSVDPGGPADKAGLKVGDVVTAVNGKEVEDANSFRNTIASTAPGTKVNLTVFRNGQQQQLTATLSEASATTGPRLPAQQSSGGQLGITIEPVTPDIAAQLGLRPGTQGLVITGVNPTGPAADAGLQPGDVIREINHQPVKSVDDIKSALAKSNGQQALLLIVRNGQSVFVTLTPAG